MSWLQKFFSIPSDGPYAYKTQEQRRKERLVPIRMGDEIIGYEEKKYCNWDEWKELVKKHRAGTVEPSKHLTEKHETVS